MKERLAKLIDVKSIMTLALTIVFCVLALTGVISGQEFITIFTVIVGFYFGTQAQKAADAVAAVQYGTIVEAVTEDPENLPEAVDEATAHRIHPPDTNEAQNA